jgi:anti-sigma regulatory factor (Ser/Thr protein kinase)
MAQQFWGSHRASHPLPHGSAAVRSEGVVTANIELPAEPGSPGEARRLVANVLRGIKSPADIDVVVLLTSEVVTNAVVHAGTSVGLVVRDVHEGIQIEVSDGDKHMPEVDRHDVESVSGHGMSLVALLSQSWGAIPTGEGKTVWFRCLTRSGLRGRLIDST